MSPPRTRPQQDRRASVPSGPDPERTRSRSGRASARAVATWCDDLAREVRSGSSLRDAIAAVPADATTALATAPARLAIDRGISVADAVSRLPDAGPHLQLALAVIATASRVGGPAATAIERTAMALRQRAADQDERSAQAAQARLSTHVMTAVPLLMLGALVSTDDDVRAVTTSPIGAICIAIGLGLNALGWLWMRHIVGTTS